MKRKITRCLYILAFLFCVTNCSDDNTDEKSKTYIVYFSKSGCKPNLADGQSTSTHIIESQQYVEYSSSENGILCISHINALFCCEQKSINVSATISDNIIEVDEEEYDAFANCLCPIDLYYEISSLEQGNTYTLIIRQGQLEITRFTFTYNLTLNNTILI